MKKFLEKIKFIIELYTKKKIKTKLLKITFFNFLAGSIKSNLRLNSACRF